MIGNKMRAAIKAAKENQYTASEKLGISQGGLNLWLSGKRSPTPEDIKKFCEVFHRIRESGKYTPAIYQFQFFHSQFGHCAIHEYLPSFLLFFFCLFRALKYISDVFFSLREF